MQSTIKSLGVGPASEVFEGCNGEQKLVQVLREPKMGDINRKSL